MKPEAQFDVESGDKKGKLPVRRGSWWEGVSNAHKIGAASLLVVLLFFGWPIVIVPAGHQAVQVDVAIYPRTLLEHAYFLALHS